MNIDAATLQKIIYDAVILQEIVLKAEEFIKYIAKQEKADECFAVTAIYIKASDKLRHKADNMDKHDAMIDRARWLLPGIEAINTKMQQFKEVVKELEDK